MGHRARSIGFLPAPTTNDGVPNGGGRTGGGGGQSVQRRREKWREWWESRQTGHHGGRHGNDSIAGPLQNALTPFSPYRGALALEVTTPFISGCWGRLQPRSMEWTNPSYWSDTCVPSSPRVGHDHTCEGPSARYKLWRTWVGSMEWSRPSIGAWQGPPSETRRIRGRTEGWKSKRCPYWHSPVARRSSGPDLPCPSAPSRASGVWGRHPGFDDEEPRTRPSGLDATRTVIKSSSENWAHTPRSGRGGSVTMDPRVAAGRSSCAHPGRRGWSRYSNTDSGGRNSQVTGGIVGDAGVLPYRSTSPSPPRSDCGGSTVVGPMEILHSGGRLRTATRRV